ncbi:hypothetical protein [Flectobacillus sp.]|uniref:hypothetical protein n=1 Tax=Flectobacillus sp. TaxID=50419 RepID=UPI003BABB6F8
MVANTIMDYHLYKRIQEALSNSPPNAEQQAFNWLVVGAQKTAKTTTVLQLAYIIQAMAMQKKLIKKVLIYDPMWHESFEPAGIRKAIGFIHPNFVLPNYKVITVDEIQSYGASKEDYYCWAVVRDRGSRVQDFCQEALTVKNAITILDDVGSRITGNVRNFPQYIDLLAYNRINCNDVFLIYHQYKYVPPSFWQYFQRAIVKQSNEQKFSDDIYPRDLYIQAQKEVTLENKERTFPNKMNLAYRILLPNENLIFKEDNGYFLATDETGNEYLLFQDQIIDL